MNLGLLCSGGLGLEMLNSLNRSHQVKVVLTDQKSVKIIEYCNQYNISVFVGNPRGGKGYSFLLDYKVDVLISINYLFLIEKDMISYPEIMAFNIHGSLLPKYRGRTPHVWAIINNEKETGVTAHRITEGCDEGDIIEQVKVSINENDTGNDILEKFAPLYKMLVDNVLQKIISNSLTCYPQDPSLATKFGKRTPADGRINWDWQKERIYNWVRAQSFPYPGAFTYYGNEKMIIDEIRIVDNGYTDTMQNGLVIKVNPTLVKTPNGIIQISKARENYTIEAGEILK